MTIPTTAPAQPGSSRREFLRRAGRYLSLAGLLALAGALVPRRRRQPRAAVCAGCPQEQQCRPNSLPLPATATGYVWQLDPNKCVQCGRCATACVLGTSAVKCVHCFALCGYCKLCFGYFQPGASALTADAENQLCPTGALRRRLVEDPYYEYTVDESLCIGCSLCVKGCTLFGNGSLCLQVHHDRCVNCNECAIAQQCPSSAFARVPANRPYLLKGQA